MAAEVVDHARAAELIRSWRRVIVLTHERPDGDALGCLIAIQRLLAGLNIEATPFTFGGPPGRYQPLLRRSPISGWSPVDQASVAEHYDGLIIADTCALAQLTPVLSLLESKTLPTLVVDHHVTRDDIADYLLVDSTASSASLLVAEWASAVGWTIDRQAAEAMFIGMATDTGWFRFSNCDSRTLRVAASLLDLGVKPDCLYQELYLSDSPGRIRLVAAVLASMTLHADDRLAVCAITPDVIDAAGATLGDADDLVNESQRIGRVDASVLLLDRGTGPIKTSFRSKHALDVAAIAQTFGGGGHTRASGARIEGTLESVRERVTAAMVGAFEALD
jgi:phosphoesterase RecJ-like protein